MTILLELGLIKICMLNQTSAILCLLILAEVFSYLSLDGYYVRKEKKPKCCVLMRDLLYFLIFLYGMDKYQIKNIDNCIILIRFKMKDYCININCYI